MDRARPAVAILAGGHATRFGGGDKTLSDLAGKSVLARIIDRMAPQGSALVLSANGDPARFARFGLPVLPDDQPGRMGPLAGMLAALDWVMRNCPDVTDLVTVPADTPFLPRDLVEQLGKARDASEDDLAWAISIGRVHPVVALVPVRLAPDLRQAIEVEGVRKVESWIQRNRVSRVEFPLDPEHGIDPFFNVNSRADLAVAEAVMRRPAQSSDGIRPGN